jgi:ribosomal protein S12 methylthiotransferase accessory factor
MYLVRANLSDASVFVGSTVRSGGSGASVDPDRARIKAVGEAIERYCSAIHAPERLVYATWNDLGEQASPPETFALFSQRQYAEPGFPFAPFTRETPINWVRGYSLVHRVERYVPAAYTYLAYEHAEHGEARFNQPISTGCAAGPTLAAAATKAILESIERDAFMITWQHRLAPQQVDLERVADPLVIRLLDAFAGLPVTIRAVSVSVDIGIPVILIVVASASGQPPCRLVAMGTDPDPARALVLALEEACLSFWSVRRIIAHSTTPPMTNFDDITQLHDRAEAYALLPGLQPALAFLEQPKGVLDVVDAGGAAEPGMSGRLRRVMDEVATRGLDVIAVDLTTPDIDDVGFKVVRAVIPGLQPLDIDHRHRHLGGRRLAEVPWRMGLANAPVGEDAFNPHPHPFP